MIDFNSLTHTYPEASHPALTTVTLHVDEGEFVLVAGQSGAGKSTLLRCLNGLVPHFTGGTLSGRVTVAGHDPVAEGPQALSQIVGFVFQDPEAQFVVDRVEDEIAFALENAATASTEMHVRVEKVLNLLGLTPLRNRALETLSGGEKQRVAIAAALALRPRVLVLDEPTSQLDPGSAEEVLSALVRLSRDLGLTVVLAEHRLERVLPHVDRVVYLPGSGGRMLSGRPRDVLSQMSLTPPLLTLAKALGWDPLPLTVEEGRAFVEREGLGWGFQASNPDPDAHAFDFEVLLRVEELCFKYNGAPALHDVTLSVGKGEVVALVGPNGSGKTTLLRCIVGLLLPGRGRIELAGESLVGRETADICRTVGYLPQEPDALLFAETVAQELAVTLQNHGLQGSPPIAPADLLSRLGLSGLSASYPRDLSVGERQRVALGAVTVTRPKLLLLDEPTRGMDYSAKRRLARLLREWQEEQTGVLLVTHDVELVAQVADRVVVLDHGAVTADGPPGQVLGLSSLFAPQMARLFPGRDWLTAEEALAAVNAAE